MVCASWSGGAMQLLRYASRMLLCTRTDNSRRGSSRCCRIRRPDTGKRACGAEFKCRRAARGEATTAGRAPGGTTHLNVVHFPVRECLRVEEFMAQRAGVAATRFRALCRIDGVREVLGVHVDAEAVHARREARGVRAQTARRRVARRTFLLPAVCAAGGRDGSRLRVRHRGLSRVRERPRTQPHSRRPLSHRPCGSTRSLQLRSPGRPSRPPGLYTAPR